MERRLGLKRKTPSFFVPESGSGLALKKAAGLNELDELLPLLLLLMMMLPPMDALSRGWQSSVKKGIAG